MAYMGPNKKSKYATALRMPIFKNALPVQVVYDVDMALNDIGEMCGVSRQAIHKTLKRALIKFRKRFIELYGCPFEFDNGIALCKVQKVDTEAINVLGFRNDEEQRECEKAEETGYL